MASTTLKQTVLFTPTLIPGCVLWLDGADPAGTGVKPANGATISTWVDKSSSGYNATISSGRIGGTFSSAFQTMYFQSSNVGYQTSYSANPTNETMFFVANIDSPANINNNTIIGGQLGARSFGFGYTGGGSTGTSGYLNNEVAWPGSYSPAGSTPAGVTALITGTITSTTTLGVGVNGSNLTTGAFGYAWYSGTTTYLGVDTTTTNYYYKGYIMDIIFYNSVLSTAQRQQIEGYLAWKWGLQGLLPLSHAYKNFSPFVNTTVSLPVTLTMPLRQVNTAGFLPTQISGCQLWLDAADSNAIINGPGSQVSQLTDKSGNSYNATQGTSASQPVRAGNYITFSSNRYFNFSQAAINNTSTYSIFLVFNPAASVNWIIQKQANGVGSYNMLSMTNYWQTNVGVTNYLYWNSWANSYSPLNSGTALQLNTVQLVEVTYNGTTLSMYLNGTLLSSASGTYNIQNKTDATNCTIGSWIADGSVQNSGVTNFNFGELIYHNTAITTMQRQQIEGYLALKWGLNASLPNGHPFKSIPQKIQFPSQLALQTSTNWKPTNYSGCALWLDGADKTTVSFSSGSNVSLWTDKSGNGRNATVYNGTTTYTLATGMTFNGSSSLQVSYTASPTLETLFVIVKFNSVSAQGDIFSGTATGQREYLMYFPYSPGTMFLGRYGTAPSGAINGGTVTTAINYMLGYVFNGSANTISFYQAGNTVTSGTPQFTYSSGGSISLLGSYGGGGFLQGQIYELIVFNTTLTDIQRQQMEGYLAWKWSLQGNLPATHPFKNFPPPPQ